MTNLDQPCVHPPAEGCGSSQGHVLSNLSSPSSRDQVEAGDYLIYSKREGHSRGQRNLWGKRTAPGGRERQSRWSPEEFKIRSSPPFPPLGHRGRPYSSPSPSPWVSVGWGRTRACGRPGHLSLCFHPQTTGGLRPESGAGLREGRTPNPRPTKDGAGLGGWETKGRARAGGNLRSPRAAPAPGQMQ